MLTQYMQYERNSTKNIYNHSYNTSYTYHIFSIEPEASALSTPKAKDKMKWCTMMAACLSDIKHLAHLHTRTKQKQKKTQTRAQQHVRAHTHTTLGRECLHREPWRVSWCRAMILSWCCSLVFRISASDSLSASRSQSSRSRSEGHR